MLYNNILRCYILVKTFIMAKEKISALSIADLISYVKAAETICIKYENSIRTYDGSINTQTKEYSVYQKFNDIRFSLLSEIEKRLSNLE